MVKRRPSLWPPLAIDAVQAAIEPVSPELPLDQVGAARSTCNYLRTWIL
jgi:hypothetical protein